MLYEVFMPPHCLSEQMLTYCGFSKSGSICLLLYFPLYVITQTWIQRYLGDRWLEPMGSVKLLNLNVPFWATKV